MYSKQYNIKNIVLKTLENFGWHYMSAENLKQLEFNPNSGIINSVFKNGVIKLNAEAILSEENILNLLTNISTNKSFIDLLNDKNEITVFSKDLCKNSFIVSDNFICNNGTVLDDSLILFINGIPVSFILCDNKITIGEAKNSLNSVNSNQYLSKVNLFNVIINEKSLFYGNSSLINSDYKEWKWKYSYGIIPDVIDNNPFYETNKYFNTSYNIELYQNIYGLLNVQHLNILIRDFIKFNDDGLKILPSYQEFKGFDSCVTC